MRHILRYSKAKNDVIEVTLSGQIMLIRNARVDVNSGEAASFSKATLGHVALAYHLVSIFSRNSASPLIRAMFSLLCLLLGLRLSAAPVTAFFLLFAGVL